MPNVKFSELPLLANLSDNAIIPIVVDSNNFIVTGNTIKNYVTSVVPPIRFSVAGDDSTTRVINNQETIKFVGATGISTSTDAEGNVTITGPDLSGYQLIATAPTSASQTYSFNVAGDDSTLKTISNGETIKFIGASNISTSTDAEGNVTITGPNLSSYQLIATAFSGDYDDLTNKPTFNSQIYSFSVAGDDSTLKTISNGETIKFVGATGISTSTDAEGNVTITGPNLSSYQLIATAFSGDYDDLTNKPTFNSQTYSFNVAGDDSTLKTISNGETIKFIGASNISTSTDAEGNVTITGPNLSSYQLIATAFSGDYDDLTNKPTSAPAFSFSVAADDSTQRVISTDEVIKFIGASNISTSTDAEGNVTITGPSLGSFTFAGSVVDTNDSSGINITPAVTFNSDIIAENGLTAKSNIVPFTDSIYDLGAPGKRFRDLYLSGNSLYIGSAVITATGNAVNLPTGSTINGSGITSISSQLKGTSVTYPGNDLAADPAGGQLITITGTGFESTPTVYIGGTIAPSISFINSTQINVTVPAKSSGTYDVYIINPGGSTAIMVMAISYSGIPAWTTTAGNLGTLGANFSIQLEATSNSVVSYQLAAGSTLPSGVTLSSSGLLTGVNIGTEQTFNFTVSAVDTELQDTPRSFSVTVTFSDAYFNRTTLLLNTSSTNGAQNNIFLDSGTANGGVGFTITRNGNATQGTFSPFSQTGWSNLFDGSNDDFYVPYSSSLNLSTPATDWTVECFFQLSSNTAAMGLMGASNGGGDTAKYFMGVNWNTSFAYAANRVNFFTNSGGSEWIDAPYSWVVGEWYHIAAVYTHSNTTITLYVNGVSVGSIVNNAANTTGSVFVGQVAEGYYFHGYISNLRITKGGALYTSSFTPSTVPLTTTVSSGTVSLLTCQSNRFVDNSTNNFALTINSTPSVQAFSPFAPTVEYSTSVVGGSAYFDGTGDYLSTDADLCGFAAGDEFSIEFFVYFNSIPSSFAFIGSTAGTFAYIALYDTANGIYSGKTNEIGSASIIKTNALTLYPKQWYHICFARRSAVMSIYVNGARLATRSSDTTNYTVGNGATIGYNSSASANPVDGYMSQIRVLRGASAYDTSQTTLTVPTSPLTAITNTKMLISGTNAGIFDSTAKNDLETVGNAQVSTIQAKWGTTSMSFDGSTSSWLVVPNRPTLDLSTGAPDWTLECWGYVANFTNSPYFFNKGGVAASTYTNYSFSMTGNTSSGTVYCTLGNNGAETSYSFGTCAVNTWYHFAATRSGSTIRTFLNGVLVTSQSIATTMTDGGQDLYVGCLKNLTTNVLNGYIDDLRVTKGYARYTATFTPPIAAFIAR
jgi:hypothetical protein